MFRERCPVVSQERTAPGHYVLTLRSARLSRAAKPGQFVQILCSEGSDPLLPRPFSFLDASGREIAVLYQVVGKGTELLSRLGKGDALWVTGPLGNGFSIPRKSGVSVLVGGGVGIPPLYHWAKEYVSRRLALAGNVHVFLGARHKSLLLCETDFRRLGVRVHVATDDGSKGLEGFVTQAVEKFIVSSPPILHSSLTLYACGPTPMLKAVSALAIQHKVSCEVSVEVPMACGFGACLGCAIKIKEKSMGYGPSTAFRFAIACCEGPVFPAESLVWD